MGREIQFCLVYRDMWQSSGKYMPRVDQLAKVAEPIVEMGCFSRVETNGGGFEQICLLAGEDPNRAVRTWTQPFNDAGIQTQMLERGLNGLRMSPVPADVRQLMFKVKKKQGTDISRSFDGLNNGQNLALSFQYAKEGGMVAQAALSITHSPIHTVAHYVAMADEFIGLGAQEICIKDMAGVGRPASIGAIVKGIKARHPKMLVQYHGHATPGFSVASSLEAARHGADIIDVGMEPLSWGTGHADLLTIHAMLKDAGFLVPDVDTRAYMEVRRLTQDFIDDFLGYWISPSNRLLNSLLIGPGLPGGMMGSLMADLENNLKALNKWLAKNGQAEMSEQDLLLRLFDEVEYAWPRLGYPPLVTPYSQYVKNVALGNAIQVIKGQPRWAMIDENTWDMILGKAGKLPGELGKDIVALAHSQGREFFEGNPQDWLEDALPTYKIKMAEKGWDEGPDQEELFEYAMHPGQYEEYKNGKAKERFLGDLAKKRAGEQISASAPAPAAAPTTTQAPMPSEMDVEVNGEVYRVRISYDGQVSAAQPADASAPAAPAPPPPAQNGAAKKGTPISSPLEGKLLLTKDPHEKAIKVGDKIQEGSVVAYVESMKVINAVTAHKGGTVLEVKVIHGQDIEEDDTIVIIG